MNRRPDGAVLFEDEDVMATLRQRACRRSARRTGANDDDVPDARRQNFLPLTSQEPRNVIQNDSMMSRKSSQKDWLRM